MGLGWGVWCVVCRVAAEEGFTIERIRSPLSPQWRMFLVVGLGCCGGGRVCVWDGFAMNQESFKYVWRSKKGSRSVRPGPPLVEL